MNRAHVGEERDLQAQTRVILSEMRSAVLEGRQPWFHALLDAIRLWPLPEEQVGGRFYRYLIGGEAFDWLLLAERLCEEIEDLTPEDEREQLLFHGRFPSELDEDEFKSTLGAKYRAHLNFIYGVRVENALQLAVAEEVSKERHASRIWENGHADDEVFSRIYGAHRLQLLAQFRSQRDETVSEDISLADLDEFTYWLFRYRVNNCDPAKVASDTRKGLALLHRLEARRKRGGSGTSLP